MPKVLILHLSDVHVADASDVILDRAGLIAAAIQDMELGIDHAAILVSGDLAQSGKDPQYLLIWEFLERLKGEMQHRLSQRSHVETVPVSFLAIPGNHDCDVDNQSMARPALIRDIDSGRSPLSDPDIVQICVSVQDAFFEYLTTFGETADRPWNSSLNKLFWKYRLEVDDKSIELMCLNSAWTSLRNENQAHLQYDPSLIPAVRPTATVAITVLHHPYNWFPADPAREIRTKIEAISDFVITGHEHDDRRRVQILSTGETNVVIEAAALQDRSNPESSGFGVIILDLDSVMQRTATFRWDHDKYRPQGVISSAENSFGTDWEPLPAARARLSAPFRVSESFLSFLNDLGMPLIHKSHGQVSLNDLFVMPGLIELDDIQGGLKSIVKPGRVAELLSTSSRVVILGGTDSGKTCLAKAVYRLMLERGYVPVYAAAGSIVKNTGDLQKLLSGLVEHQYDADAVDSYFQLDKSQRVIIIDDYEALKMRPERKNQFLESLDAFFGKIMILGHAIEMQVREVFDFSSRVNSAAAFTYFQIAPLGRVGRDDLLTKWVSLDRDVATDGSEYARRRNELSTILDQLTANDRLSRSPIVLISALGAAETMAPMDPTVGTYEAYYDLIIKAILLGDGKQAGFDIISRLLSYSAFQMFERGQKFLKKSDWEAANSELASAFGFKILDSYIARSFDSGILVCINDRVEFGHKYSFYYFVALWLRDNLDQDSVKKIIRKLAVSTYAQEYANILLFLAHLSRDPFISSQMIESGRALLEEFPPSDMSNDVRFLDTFGAALPTWVHTASDPEVERRNDLEMLDEALPEEALSRDPGLHLPPLLEEAPNLGFVSELVMGTKAVETIGQVLRNFPASLRVEEKVALAKECYELGLRVLGAFFARLDQQKERVFEFVVEMMDSSSTAGTKLEKERAAADMIVFMANALATVFVEMIAEAVSASELEPIYKLVQNELPSVPVEIINASIELRISRDVPEGALLQLAGKVKNEPMQLFVLQAMVTDYLRLHRVRTDTAMRLCEAVGIQYRPTLLAGVGDPGL